MSKIKLICAALALALTLAGCTAAPSQSAESDRIEFESMEDMHGGSVEEFELTDVMTVFARDAYSDVAVGSPNFAVDHTVFEALFNLVLYFETTPGDGVYDEFDEYFDSGALDLTKSVRSQKIPDKDVYWYSEARSRAMKVCYDALHYFEYAKAHSMSPISRTNEVRIHKIMRQAEDGHFGSDITEYFGEGATLPVLRAAAALWVISQDPSAFITVSDLETTPRPEYDTDKTLNPAVAAVYES